MRDRFETRSGRHLVRSLCAPVLIAQRQLRAGARENTPAASPGHGSKQSPLRALSLGLLAAASLAPGLAFADTATSLSKTALPEQSGAAIYQHVCQGCHQPGGRGAVGAGAFPALANNQKLSVAGYPISMVLNGNGGMPWFNGQLTDGQVADIVNYVRTHFGNAYADAVTPADVAAARGPVPVLER